MDHLILKYHIGEYLNIEQKICLESSLLVLQAENQLKRTNFWGKINGIQQDYFIVRGYMKDYFENVKYYYSNNLLDWTLVPKVRKSSRKPTRACSFHFTGIPSHVFEVALPDVNSEVWQLQMVGLKEEDRLAATIEMINEEINVIPRGAFHTLPDGTVLKNSVYKGMNEVMSLRLKSYIHFEDLRRCDEPFPYWNSKNTIDSDYPPGSWSLYPIDGGQVAALHSLIWPGLIFYYQPNTPNYNLIYCGDGLKKLDLYFVI